MNFMKSESRVKLKIKILDSCVLVDCAKSRQLKEYLMNLSKNYRVLITTGVRTEAKNILIDESGDPEIVIYFEKTIKELRKTGAIVKHLRYDRLDKKFKTLKQALRGSRPRVELVDRTIISLACQLGGKLCSKDTGIERAISKIKKASRFRQWRPYAKKMVIQEP